LYPQVWASPAFPEFLRKTSIAAYWDEMGAPANCVKNASGDYRKALGAGTTGCKRIQEGA